MSLLALQKSMAAALMRPLVPGDHADPDAPVDYIKPNSRLTSLERLEIYSRSYWYRLFDSLYEDFPGLRAVLGQRAFGRLSRAYLTDRPSASWTLRNLGSRLEEWLRRNPSFAGGRLDLAIDMIRLEWAHIEAFDGKEEPVLGPEDLLELGPDLRIGLQPHIRLIELRYPVDDLRVKVNAASEEHGTASNAVLKRRAGGLVRRIQSMAPEHIFLAVHRLDFMVYYRRLDAEEFRLLAALGKGLPVGRAVEAALEDSPVPVENLRHRVESWFAAWAEMGWLCRRS
ncbi:MAG TPA: DNA-binding domain-containing protein [Bryobacteraceae bacterium]|nr:DNA-binding domain-containing protein [Bryobacteraceae bacterium]